MRYFMRVFVRGALLLIPIIITFYICYWLVTGLESLFKNILLFIVPRHYFEKYYSPGVGTLAGICFILIVGILMEIWGMRKLYAYGEKFIEKFPVVGDIYATLKSLLQYFISTDKKRTEQVVILEYNGLKVLGIVTREDFENAPSGIGGQDIVAVFLPMSYQLGGYTIYIPKKYITPINMTKKEALQWIITAGLG